MLGMEMMLKNLTGLDVSDLQGAIQKAQADAAQVLSQVFDRLDRIQQTQEIILENQQIQYQLLRKAGLIEDVSSLAKESTNEHRAADKH